VSSERLSPVDASFLQIEDDVTHMHIGAVSIMEGPPPSYRELYEMVAAKLASLPRCRQVIRTVPLGCAYPVWVDDASFDLGFHLRRAALPRPGSRAELRCLVEHLMEQKLDRARPLWEIWMVEGLGDGTWAIVSKVHHCMADGVAGSDLLGLMLDASPTHLFPPARPWVPEPGPASRDLAAGAIADLVSSPFELAHMVLRFTLEPGRAWAETSRVLRTLRGAAGWLRGPDTQSLNGPIGPHRRWAQVAVPVEVVKAVRHRAGGTFNDVVLAAVTRGFRDLLAHRGEAIDHPVRTLVPVSMRARDDSGRPIGDGTFTNKVSGVVTDLPVGIPDPLTRLRTVSAQMAKVKDSDQLAANQIVTSITEVTPPLLISMAGRLGTKLPQHRVNTVVTNVPGPQIPLYATGRRMLEVYPFAPIALQTRISVAVFSYDGKLSFGITGDRDTCPDIDVLAEGIIAGMSELHAIDGGARIIDLAGRDRDQRASSN
jgi:WS/DGAT/MGAT family acyltransferase